MKRGLIRRALWLGLLAGLAGPVGAAPRTPGEWYGLGMREYYSRLQPTAGLEAFRRSVQLNAGSPMAHLMLSRALAREGHLQEAYLESVAALSKVVDASDEESYLIRAWAAHMGARAHPSEHQHGEGDAVDAVDMGIAVYPQSVELYILAGEMAPTALQSTPYYLAALKLRPDHPLGQRWKPRIPPLPRLHPEVRSTPVVRSGPIKLYHGLGQVHHPISTSNPKAQAYFEQGLCCLYGYVDNAARKSFAAAIALDPQCPMAWWGLSFCPPPTATASQVAARAWQLAASHGSESERRYCAIRWLQLQRGREDEALDALCGALAAQPKDVDLWMWRATFSGFAGENDDRRSLHGLPFALAAWRMAPDHPSANHELIHTYEAIDRPMLGWRFTWGFRRSAPNLPHAQHMQAHLAMRLGRWKEALSCTRQAIHLSKVGFPELDRNHHLDVYFWVLGHEGRFAEALSSIQPDQTDSSWPRLLRMKLDDQRLESWARKRRGTVGDGWYFGALADLDRGRWKAAAQEFKHFGANGQISYEDTGTWSDEVQGRLWLQSGQRARGLEKLASVARWSDTNSESHRWGQGAYYDELWGEAALQTGHLAQAREAFQEAVAHEHGSIVGALGLQVVAERMHDPVEATSFARLAHSIWSEADTGAIDRLLTRLRQIAAGKAQIF